MEQETELLVKADDVGEIQLQAPDWVLAGFKNEEEYNELLKKIDNYLKTNELHPWVKEVSGMVSSGREETMETIFEDL